MSALWKIQSPSRLPTRRHVRTLSRMTFEAHESKFRECFSSNFSQKMTNAEITTRLKNRYIGQLHKRDHKMVAENLFRSFSSCSWFRKKVIAKYLVFVYSALCQNIFRSLQYLYDNRRDLADTNCHTFRVHNLISMRDKLIWKLVRNQASRIISELTTNMTCIKRLKRAISLEHLMEISLPAQNCLQLFLMWNAYLNWERDLKHETTFVQKPGALIFKSISGSSHIWITYSRTNRSRYAAHSSAFLKLLAQLSRRICRSCCKYKSCWVPYSNSGKNFSSMCFSYNLLTAPLTKSFPA